MSRRYLEYLQEEYIDQGDYGGFYGDLRESANVSDAEAVQIVRKFKNDDIEDGLEQLEDLLA
jgi:hypothetical protein